MYTVTAEYTENIAKTVRYTGITGYIQAKSGTTYPISDKNIAANSLVITRKLNSRGDYRPGGVTAAELSVSLLGFGDISDSLDGARIVLFFLLYRSAEMTEYDRVPLGVFWVDGSQIKRKFDTVKLKAYDGLLKFDIAATVQTGTLYELVDYACSACGVYLDTTQEEFEALPNGTTTVTVDTSRIQTWRDFLIYAGLLTGCWCRMRRDTPNELQIVKLTCEREEDGNVITQRTISGDNRYSTNFSDEKTHIIKYSTRHNGTLLTQTKKLIVKEAENITILGQLELAENPLLNDKTDDEVIAALDNMALQLAQCPLRAFAADFNGDPALDIGDYVRLEGGAVDIWQNSTGTGRENGYVKAFIASQTWRYRGKHRIECKLPSLVEANVNTAIATMSVSDNDAEMPMRTTPKSQTEKRIDGLEARLNSAGGTCDTAKRLQTSDTDGIAVETQAGSGRGGVVLRDNNGNRVFHAQYGGDGIALEFDPEGDIFGATYQRAEAVFRAGEISVSATYSGKKESHSAAIGIQAAQISISIDNQLLSLNTDGLYLNGSRVLTEADIANSGKTE